MTIGTPSRPEAFDRFLGSLLGDPSLDVGSERLSLNRQNSGQLSLMRTFLRERYGDARPVATRIRHGQIFDYFHIDDQPATSRLGLIEASMPPAGFLGGKYKVGLQFASAYAKALEGLVPVRRFTLADLARFESLDRFLHKRGSPRKSILRSEPATAPSASSQTHRWVDVYQSVPNIGASANLNVWNPALAPGQTFSISQIWCVASGPNGMQTAEVGWHVYPALTGHTEPALFCYWTCDGYQQSGSYNGANGDFKICTQNTVLGTPISDFSVSGGAQTAVYCALKLYEGNWWLYVGGDQNENAVGYFPGSLYQGGPLASGAEEVDFGGEVCGGPPFPPMGSGAFASAGLGWAAYQGELGILGKDGTAVSPLQLITDNEQSQDYTVQIGSSEELGFFNFFGGPGGN